MDVQSILFPRSQWGLQMAKLWAKEHGYTLKHGVDLNDGLYYRVRQRAPQKGAKCRRKTIRSRTHGADVVLLLCDRPYGGLLIV